MRERDIQAAVIDHWRKLGLPDTLVAAVPNAKAFGQPGLTKGLFDIMVLSPKLRGKTGYIELKTENGSLSHAQKDLKFLMTRLDVPYAVTYGRDQPITVLKKWGAVRL